MTGHHIYTRSWFELGAKSRNAGTFTVELTDGIFGANSDEVIYNRLNPMCASVPEALAPLNSGKSILRIFHPLPNTTVVTRSWFVTDKITDRGPVTYAYSLIFSDGSNSVFLKNPEKAFSPGAMEPYESFYARVTPDAPVVISTKYDPAKEDYVNPFVFDRSKWSGVFGFDRELFVNFFGTVCKAICDKGYVKAGAVLPGGKDGELLILATLSLLPMFMKRKFGAASNWKGMLDGSSSKAINGLHLVCYYDERPIYDTKLPVVDLTGANRHENLDTEDRNYVGWVWDNIDDSGALAGFEGFLTANFEAVLDKMPFQVIETCFLLWNVFINLKKTVDFPLAATIIKLITDSFAKNFTKYPFIHERIKECLAAIRNGLITDPRADLAAETIQAVCLLANNGEEDAMGVVYDIHKHLYRRGEWKKVSITAAYFAGLLERPGIATDVENRCCEVLLECLTCADPTGAKVAQNAIGKYCLRLRSVILGNKAKADAAFANYSDAVFALHSASGGNLSDAMFRLPEITGAIDMETANWFIKLAALDIERLGYIPSPARWIETLKWIEPIWNDIKKNMNRMKELYLLYYSKIPNDNKREYILHIEKESLSLLIFLRLIDNSAGLEIERILIDCFIEGFNNAGYVISADETWDYVRGWLERLDALKYEGDEYIFDAIRKAARIDEKALFDISGSISNDSLQTIVMLYGNTDPRLDAVLKIFGLIDAAADRKAVTQDMLQDYLRPGALEIQAYYDRMNYWYMRGFNDQTEWALFMLAAVTAGVGFDADEFIMLCRSKNNVPGSPVAPDDMVCIFSALKLLDIYQITNRGGIRTAFLKKVAAVLNTAKAEDVFVNEKVIRAFSGWDPQDQPGLKYDIGRMIAGRLHQNKDISDDIRDSYFRFRRAAVQQADNDSPIVVIIAAFSALMLVVSLLLTFVFGNGEISQVIAPVVSFWVEAGMALLVIASSIIASVMYLSEK